MEGILPLLLWGGLFFLMMRFGCGSHLFGGGHGRGKADAHDHGAPGATSAKRNQQLVWTAPETDTDPVCGKEVHTAGAKSTVHEGWVYYFCSRECRELFEAAPRLYLKGDAAAASATALAGIAPPAKGDGSNA